MRKFLFLLLAFFLTANFSLAAIRISPSIIDIDVKNSKRKYVTGSFSVSGGKDEVIRFKIYPEFFEHDEFGQYVKLPDKGQANSLMGKVKFYPSEFTCKNGKAQKVRFTVTGINSLPDGESRLVLFLEDTKTREVIIKNIQGNIDGKIIVKTRVGVPIYLNTGKFKKKGELLAASFGTKDGYYNCNYSIKSNSNSRIRYGGYAYVSQNKKLIKKIRIRGSSVDPLKTLEKNQKLVFEPGEINTGETYKVKFILTYKNEKNREDVLKKEFEFSPIKLDSVNADVKNKEVKI